VGTDHARAEQASGGIGGDGHVRTQAALATLSTDVAQSDGKSSDSKVPTMTREPSNRLLILVAALGLIPAAYFTVKATGTPTTQPPSPRPTSALADPTEDLHKPTIDLTAVYTNHTPFPVESPTPIDPNVGVYVGWTNGAIAANVVTLLDESSESEGPITVLLTRDVSSHTRQSLVEPALIAYNGEPDLAIVMSGEFRNPMPYDAASAAAKPFMTVLVDRISGSIYMSSRSTDLESLMKELPPPEWSVGVSVAPAGHPPERFP